MREHIQDNKITLVLSEDWIAMYVNGDLSLENHSLRPDEILRELGFPVEVVSLSEEQVEVLGWQMPMTWGDREVCEAKAGEPWKSGCVYNGDGIGGLVIDDNPDALD